MTPESIDKWRYSLLSLLVFILVVNPYTYRLTNSISPIKTIQSGAPSFFGLCLHGLVFLVIIRYMMDLKL